MCSFSVRTVEEVVSHVDIKGAECLLPEQIIEWAYLDDLLAYEQELADTKNELEQSEICCTEWEKQALDYKAENIGLRSKLDIAVDALKGIKDECYDTTDVLLCVNKALEQINDNNKGE